ncbi:P-loop containing nucleoside triphosphate hydrolase protein [Cylindrobasidium torrendii FP15055 ss-10]|uniref:DNA 3'-5' helicase n=1 Tax=Cylindrobasidium torrendii FP15055 ss-10 TaxID=1314674 RepID=A0A0D7B6I0_9AGAR|nr:P-loop containing nucleoside triphosphate hydrolase protein [Cylindrobasidium torrendii FP15055 ss-10]
MPFEPPSSIDEARFESACATACTLFNIPEVRKFQRDAARQTILGHDLLLGAPSTGAGKTLIFVLPLLYYWTPGQTETENRKTIFVMGPLSALLQAQANEFTQKGIPSIALTGRTPNLRSAMEACGQGDFCVVFAGPEMAKSAEFRRAVLTETFLKSLISAVTDEAHTLTKWVDFRPEFADVPGFLRKAIPSGVPMAAMSATLPQEVVADIKQKVGFGENVARIELSNSKPNIALSVRIMQHSEESLADLMSLIPHDATTPEDIPQTIIYTKTRQEAHRVQDFLRRNCAGRFPANIFEFYESKVGDRAKERIEKQLETGELRIVIATKALGMVIYLLVCGLFRYTYGHCRDSTILLSPGS